jgi:hypothetical protein
VYVSVTEPIRKAIRRTWWVLVTTGDVEKWARLGFCAFLSGGIGFGYYDTVIRTLGFGTPSAGPDEPVTALLMFPLVLWVSSRGLLMLLDGIIRNRGAVSAPWRAWKTEGNRLFVARLVLTLAWLVPVVFVYFAAAPGDAGGDAPFGWAVLVGLGLLVAAAALVLLGVQLLLLELVVPTMYLRRLPVLAAWREVREELLPGHGWSTLLFFLIQALLRLAAIVLLLLAWITLQGANAVGGGPVMILLTTVILLLVFVLYVFRKTYTLFFIEQFGPRWHVFVHDPVGPYCRWCGYDLSGTPVNQCSECGAEIPAVQWEWLQQQRNAPNQ